MSKLLPNQVYAGLMEIIKNNKMYYHTAMGDNYCHLTDEGKEEVIKWLELMAPGMRRLDHEILDKRAKELVIQELKK